MRRLLFFIGTFAFFVSTINLNQASAMELKKSESDVIVAQEDEKDGVNDPSSVNMTITKKPYNPIVVFGAGSWDYLGYSEFFSKSKTFNSGGGDLKIEISQPPKGPGFKWTYKLVEEDVIGNDIVGGGSFNLPNEAGTYVVTFNVRSYIDGADNKAELHLEKLTNPFDSVYTEWWD